MTAELDQFIERDADGSYLVTDSESVVYGHGATEAEARADYERSRCEYQEIISR